jgi:D-alanyl-D-alanine carboxypeptidase (penicillin-binding protein 5/6)
VLLARAAMQNAVFAEIVAQPQVDLPAAGTVYNVDAMLGQHGVIGVKTGSSPEAGAAFVFAADVSGGGANAPPRRIFGAVIGLDRLQDVFAASGALIDAVGAAARRVEIVPAGTAVGEVTTGWGDRIDVTTGGALSVLSWPGEPVQATLDTTAPPLGAPAGTQVGTLAVEVAGEHAQVPLLTAAPVTSPGWRWRVFR